MEKLLLACFKMYNYGRNILRKSGIYQTDELASVYKPYKPSYP